MRSTSFVTRLASLIALPLAAAACGGDGGAPADAGPDAGPDAMPGAYTCIGGNLPTSGSDPIVVTGTANEATASGQTPLDGVQVTVFDSADVAAAPVATSNAEGIFTLNINNDASTPLDGYMLGHRVNMPTFRDVYLYPPEPLTEDTDNAPLLFISDGTFNLIQTLTSQTQSSANGWIGVLVTDCLGDPVTNAVVTTTPPFTVKYNVDGFPNGDAAATDVDGIAYVFNVTPGDVTVDATFQGMSFREHSVQVRAAVITTTAVAPGHVTPPAL